MKSVKVLILLLIRPLSCHSATHLPTAPDVRYRKYHAPVEQREQRGVEPRVDRRFVGAVPVEEGWGREGEVPFLWTSVIGIPTSSTGAQIRRCS